MKKQFAIFNFQAVKFTLATALFLFQAVWAHATVFTFSGTGNWTDAARWSPSYPGLSPERYVPSGADNSIVIATGAVCTVNDYVNCNLQLTNNGTVIVAEGKSFYNKSSWGNLINNKVFTVKATAYFENVKDFTNSAGATFEVSGKLIITYSGKLINNGVFNAPSGSNLGCDGVWTNNSGSTVTSACGNFNINNSAANFTINAGSTVTLQAGSLIRLSNGAFTNNGTFNNAGTLEFWKPLKNNTGATLVNTGFLDMRSGGQIVNTGTFQTSSADNYISTGISNNAGGTIKGTGTLRGGSIYNTGVMSPGGDNIGILTLNYVNQTALDCRNGGSVNIQIAGTGGPGAGNGHDKLVLQNCKASFSLVGVGSININLINGYVPAPGTTFQILDCVGLSPMATMNYPALPNGRTWTYSYTYSGATIAGILLKAN